MLAGFALLNLLAYRHARAMTHFAPVGHGGRRADGWRDKSEHPTLFEKTKLAFSGISFERPAEDAWPNQFDLPYEIHAYAGEAGRLAAWHIPHEHPAGLVVLFHGYAAGKARLLSEARAFHDLGYDCFLVDFRGSGSSDGEATTIGFHEADDVRRTVAYVREHWPDERLMVFGQSMGAAAVLRALAQHTIEPDAVVLECPFDRLLSTVEARFAITGLPAFPGAHLLVFWGGLQHGFNGFAHNPVEYAREVTCPTLLLHGTADARVRAGQIRSIYQNLRGEKQLHFFEGVGHESYTACRADEWKKCVAPFLHSCIPVE